MPRPRNPRNPGNDDRDPRGDERRGATTPRSVFRRVLLRLLSLREGHEMPSREVRALLAQRMRDQFMPADFIEVRNGQPKWVNNMQWVKKQLVMEGLIEPVLSSGHGHWRLTRNGIEAARRRRR